MKKKSTPLSPWYIIEIFVNLMVTKTFHAKLKWLIIVNTEGKCLCIYFYTYVKHEDVADIHVLNVEYHYTGN